MTDETWQRVMDEIVRRDPKQAGRAVSWLAASLGLSVQAVQNWKTRGIPPSQHAAVAKALRWTIEQLNGLTPPPVDPWPFQTVAADRFTRLSEREKGMVELAMLDMLDRLEAASGKPHAEPRR